jgi:ADP-heptose:LPS heptosyltransferase
LHIVVTRLQNIGDVLTFIPALRTLRQALPDAHITFLGKHAGGIEIMRGCPYINDSLTIRNRSLREKLRLILALRRRRADYFIISPQDLGRVPLAWLGGARCIVGYPRFCNYGRWQREKLPFLLDLAPKHDTTRTEVENCLRLVQDLLDHAGVAMPPQATPLLEYSWQTPEDEQRAAAALHTLGVAPGAPFVAAAPVSKRAAKNWPAERFVALFQRMRQTWQWPIVLLGGAAESAQLEAMATAVGAGCGTCAGTLSLAASAVVLRAARLFVGPDSGPAFLASAVGTPVVALYGPADFYRWRPPATRAPRINIFHPAPCNPCRHQRCPLETSCVGQIGLEEVWQACCRLFEQTTFNIQHPTSNVEH